MYAMAHMWRSEDNFIKFGLFFSPLICVLRIEFLCSENMHVKVEFNFLHSEY